MSTLSVSEFRDRLHTCLVVWRFVDVVARSAPYLDSSTLLEAARRAATTLSRAQVDEALAGHPRIGQSPRGTGAAAQFSRREQASSDADDAELAVFLAAGYRISFDTAAWFARTDRPTFYPEVMTAFDLVDLAEHYHVPLLLAPFAYPTYRGS